jgi:hypothetical protein
MVSAAIVPKEKQKTDKTKIRTVNKADFFIEPPFRVKGLRLISETQIVSLDMFIAQQVFARPLQGNFAVFKQVAAPTDFERVEDVLLGQ